MTKVSINSLASGFRSSNKLNENFEVIEAALDNTLSRDGTGPNEMGAPIDMNGFQVLNLPEPLEPTDPVRLQDFDELANDAIAAYVDGAVESSSLFSNAVAAVIAAQADATTIKAYGAVVNGSTNDASAVSSANTAGLVIFPRGTTRIATNTTLSADTIVLPGAIILVDNCTLTINGVFSANPEKVFTLSGTGSVSFVSNTKMSDFEILWWGPATNGTTDAHIEIQAAINAIPDRATLWITGKPNFALSSTVTIIGIAGSGKSIKASSPSATDDTFTGPRFTWTGAAGGDVFNLQRCRGQTFEGFVIDMGTAYRGMYTNTLGGSGITSSNNFRDLKIFGSSTNSAVKCFSQEDSGGQNAEFFVFERCSFYPAGARTGGVGVYLETSDSNNHGHIFRDCRFYGGRAGISGGLGLKFEGMNSFGEHDVDIDALGTAGWGLDIGFCDTENSNQFIRMDTCTHPIRIHNCRIESQAPSGTAMIKIGASTYNVIFESNEVSGALTGGHIFEFDANCQTNFTARGNIAGGTGTYATFYKNSNRPYSMNILNDNVFGLIGMANIPVSEDFNGTVLANGVLSRRGADLNIAGGGEILWKFPFHRVNNTFTISTIIPEGQRINETASNPRVTPDFTCMNRLTLFSTVGFSTNTAGNIAAAVTVPAGQALDLVYDPVTTKFYPVL